MSSPADDVINFITQFKESGDTKHLEQAKVALDGLWHQHRSKTVEKPSIQVITSKLVPQCVNRKSDVFIKPSIKK